MQFELFEKMCAELNAEYRSSIIINHNNKTFTNNYTNTKTNSNTNTYRPRRCSYCQEIGHNIRICNDQRILHFYERCINFIEHEIFNVLEYFKRFILYEAMSDSTLIKAFAISKCGASFGANIDICIEYIIFHFTPEIENRTESIYNAFVLFNNSIQVTANQQLNIETTIADKDNLDEKCECNICYESCEMKYFVKLNCSHEFCKDCIKKTLETDIRTVPCCAFCRNEIKNIEFNLESVKNEFDAYIMQP